MTFQKLKKMPLAWQCSARELIYSGNLLLCSFETNLGARKEFKWDGHTVWRVMMMLYGLAVENLVKAIIIADGYDPAPGPKNSLDKAFQHHDLSKFIAMAKLSFSPNKYLVGKLTDFITTGKYPIGKNPTAGGGSKSMKHPEDIDLTFHLLDKLEDELRLRSREVLPKEDLRQLGRSLRQ